MRAAAETVAEATASAICFMYALRQSSGYSEDASTPVSLWYVNPMASIPNDRID